MSKQLDLSKPLTDKEVAALKERHTLEYVDRMVALAQGSDFANSDSSGSEEDGYNAMKVDDLKDEIASRNADRDEDSQIPATGNKADLVAALEADDAEADES